MLVKAVNAAHVPSPARLFQSRSGSVVLLQRRRGSRPTPGRRCSGTTFDHDAAVGLLRELLGDLAVEVALQAVEAWAGTDAVERR